MLTYFVPFLCPWRNGCKVHIWNSGLSTSPVHCFTPFLSCSGTHRRQYARILFSGVNSLFFSGQSSSRHAPVCPFMHQRHSLFIASSGLIRFITADDGLYYSPKSRGLIFMSHFFISFVSGIPNASASIKMGASTRRADAIESPACVSTRSSLSPSVRNTSAFFI